MVVVGDFLGLRDMSLSQGKMGKILPMASVGGYSIRQNLGYRPFSVQYQGKTQ